MEQTPKFCRVCGARLVPSDQATGYDPYTGEAELQQSLECPNPTVVSVSGGIFGGRTTSTTSHPTWTFVNDEGVGLHWIES